MRHDKNHVTSRQEGKEGNVHKLTIKNLSYQEIANFTCKAENEVGWTRGHIEVTGDDDNIAKIVTIWPFSGIPQPPRIISEETSLYHNQYNLIFSVKSHEPLVQVKLKYKQQVTKQLKIRRTSRD